MGTYALMPCSLQEFRALGALKSDMGFGKKSATAESSGKTS
jgi:hypothetical protein